MKYIETSAKTSAYVEQAFMTMTAEIKNKFDTGVFEKPSPASAKVLSLGKNVEEREYAPCFCLR